MRPENIEFPTRMFQGGRLKAYSILLTQFPSLAEIPIFSEDNPDFVFVFGSAARTWESVWEVKIVPTNRKWIGYHFLYANAQNLQLKILRITRRTNS